MCNTLSPYCNRVIRQQIAAGQFACESEVIRHTLRLADPMRRTAGLQGSSFSGCEGLEYLLLEGLDSGPCTPRTFARKKRIFQKAFGEA